MVIEIVLQSQKKICEVCNSQLEIAGPLWIDQLFNEKFIIDMIHQIPKFVVRKKCVSILEKCTLEAEMPPTYYTLDEIASKMHECTSEDEKYNKNSTRWRVSWPVQLH